MEQANEWEKWQPYIYYLIILIYMIASLIVDGQWKIDELKGLLNNTITYFSTEDDEKIYKGQN